MKIFLPLTAAILAFAAPARAESEPQQHVMRNGNKAVYDYTLGTVSVHDKKGTEVGRLAVPGPTKWLVSSSHSFMYGYFRNSKPMVAVILMDGSVPIFDLRHVNPNNFVPYADDRSILLMGSAETWVFDLKGKVLCHEVKKPWACLEQPIVRAVKRGDPGLQ